MTAIQIKKFIRLNWVSISVISIIAGTVLLILIVTAISLFHFSTLDSYTKKSILAGMFSYIFLWLIVGSLTSLIHTLVWMFFVFGGGFAKITYKRVKETETNVKWIDVVGMEAVKKEVWEAINLLKDRAQLKQVGGKIIKGILLSGPPGCGKTYLAKAIATETGLPFLPAVGSEFVGIFVGQGAMSIKNLFKKARVLSEIHGGCIVFIDEIDSIARPRRGDSVGNVGAETAHNATINQLLADMDGIKEIENNIVVIAATNVSEDQLDPALMRAGRFDRKIYVGRPGLEDRKKIFEFYLRKTKYDSSLDTGVLAKRTVWFSPADISSMVREAVLIAVRNKRERIVYKDLSEAYDRILFGLKSQVILSEKEKRWTAYHEAGHAIIGYLTHPTDDVIKATIIPRKSFLGFVGRQPKEEIYTKTKEWFLANIKTSSAGYIAEKIKMGTTSSGVTQDFSNALYYAQTMVTECGMGPSGILGNLGAFHRSKFSEKTKCRIDEDVQKILNDCFKDVEEILTMEKDLLDNFARQLLEKEELEYDDIVEIFKKYGKERPAQDYLL